MSRSAKQDRSAGMGRLRAEKRRQGMRLLRIWVPDTRGPGFSAEARRQAELLRDAPEEAEALDFIARVMDLDPPGR